MFDKSEEYYKKALKINPEYAEAYFNYGNLLITLGKHEEAIKQFEKALEIAPNFEAARSNLNATKQELDRNKLEVAEGKLRVRHILVKTEKEAKEIMNKLKKGESFIKLASEYSIDPSAKFGGDTGFFKRGDMMKEFEQAVLKLKKNELSGIVQTKAGYHIILRLF